MAPLTPFITERVWQDVVPPTDPTRAAPSRCTWPSGRRRGPGPGRRRPAERCARPAARRAGPRRPCRGQGPHPSAAASRPGAVARPSTACATSSAREVAAELNVGRLAPLAPAAPTSSTTRRRATSAPWASGSPAHPQGSQPPSPRRRRGPAARSRRRPVRGERRRRRPSRCSPDEVIVSERPREGWSVVNEQGETVALDLDLAAALVRAGLAREVVRLLQDARKTSGLRGDRPDHARPGRCSTRTAPVRGWPGRWRSTAT